MAIEPTATDDEIIAAASEIIEMYAPSAPEDLKKVYKDRAAIYLSISDDISFRGRSAPPGFLDKIGARSALAPWRVINLTVDDE